MTAAVDVLMPLRDGTFLRPAMDSLLAQRFRNFRLVVVQDRASSETRAALAAYARNDTRVTPLEGPTSQGLAATLNHGLAACTAPLVARADADDVYHPDRLGRQVAAFAARPDLGVLSTGGRHIDAKGRATGLLRQPVGPGILRFRMMLLNPILHPGVMFRRQVVVAVGGYDPAFWTAQDSDLWARLSDRTVIDNLPDRLVDWRRHGASVTATRGDPGEDLSLQVPYRLQCAYLGTDLDIEDVRTALAALRSWRVLSTADLRRGTLHLARLLTAAEHREGRAVRRDFRRLAARGFARQASWLFRDRPRDAAWLAQLALRWAGGFDPARMATRAPTAGPVPND